MFRNRVTGRITIGQVPNLPLVVFLLAWGVRWVLDPSGALRTVLEAVAGVALTIWAVDEIARGVNPWRRLLGATVLGAVVASLL
jgi:hypothetical protein